FRELDYRQFTGQFDRVVSVGMMEHVGAGHYDEYFRKIRELLTPDGYAFIHCIGRMSPPGTTGPFIRKYIFPGGYVPALSEDSAVCGNSISLPSSSNSFMARTWCFNCSFRQSAMPYRSRAIS